MVGKCVEYPFDTVKVRLQTQSMHRPDFLGPWHCIKMTVQQEGVRGLYKGMASPLVGAMVENATLFVGYRQIQKLFKDPGDPKPLSLPQYMASGAASGALASIVLTPVELVKCRLQVQQTATATSYKGPLDAIKRIFGERGLRGFYRGGMATLMREAGGGAFWFGTYEYCCCLFLAKRQRTCNRPMTKDDLSPSELMLGGALAGMAYNASLYPVDVVKSTMQINTAYPVQPTFLQTAKDISVGGIRAFYRGCGITVLRSAPSNAVVFMTYELLSRHWGELQGKGVPQELPIFGDLIK
ncbi:mitochondrial carrier domain-containing protein [Spinellus fusiger]|nr:mitochondrial carrier domain-containing protein [Spinellus fusiger]